MRKALTLLLSFALVLELLAVPGIPSLVATAEAAEEQVLFEENFDSYDTMKEGANPNGWYFYKGNSDSTSTAVIQDGKLVFDTHSSGYDVVYLNNGEQWSNYTLEADVTYLKETGWFGLAYNVKDGRNWQRVGLSLSGGSATEPGRWAVNGQVGGKWKNDNKGNYDTSAISVGDTLRFKVESNGTNTTFSYATYTEGVRGEWIVVKSVDNINANTQSGSIGLMTGDGNSKNTKVALDNITVTSNADGSLLYSEDFSAFELQPGENTTAGIYFQQNATTTQSYIKDGHLYLDASAGKSNYDQIHFTAGMEWTDYIVEADYCFVNNKGWSGLLYRTVSGTSSQKAGINFTNSQASLNGYTKKGKWANNTEGVHVKVDTDFTPVVGTPFRMKVVVQGSKSELWLATLDSNGNPGEYMKVLAIDDIPNAHLAGSVGLMISDGNKNVTWIDNIKVTAITSHECTWSTEYSKDETYHWYACTDSDCTEVKDKDEHDYDGDTDTECNTCGYTRVLEHTCQWAESWTTSDTHHWKVCTVDNTCTEKGSYGEHVFADSVDTACDTCGYTRAVSVVYQENFDSYTTPVTLSSGVNYDTGWIYSQNAGGSAVIKDGKLCFSGSGYDVIYRDGGSTWGNYTLEADFCYTSDNAGWGGMLYNVQSGSKFQKGGISTAGSASLNGYDGGWTNNSASLNKLDMTTTDYEIPAVNKPFRMKVVVENQNATLYYAMLNEDGTMKTDYILLKTISNIPANAQTGSIGFMTSNGSKADYWVDNILVTENSPVVFTENFDGVADTTLTGNAVNTALGLNFMKVFESATAEIKGGKLYLSGANCDAVTFETGKNWTNYTVEADVSYTAATSGWGGMLFRSTDTKNFQKAAVTVSDRGNINGKLNGDWHNDKEGTTKVDFANDLTVGEEFRMKVVVEEGTASLYYARYTNGVLGAYEFVMSVSDTFAKEHMTGTIGLLTGSSNGKKVCSMTLDNIVVSHGTDRFQQAPSYNVAEVYVPDTGIVNPPVVIQDITTALPATTAGPAVALMEIDENLNILGSSGQTIATAAQFDEQCSAKVIPAYIVDSEAEATALSQFLAENDIVDAFVVSSNPNLIYQVRTTTNGKYVRGVLMCDDLSTSAAKKAAYRTANDCLANVLLYDQELTVDEMGFFNARDIAVWSTAADTAGVYAAVAAGYSAVVVSDPATAYDVYSSITTTTVSGEPVIISHRGHTHYPENTILGFQKALEAGCLAVEIDVKLSKDGQLVLMHDGTIDRTTASSGNVGNFTAEELGQIVVNDIAYNEADITDANGEKHLEWVTVPTLASVLDYFKDTDLVFYCHMAKTTATVEAFNELMKSYEDMKDQTIFFVSWTYMPNANYTNVTDGIAFAAGDRSEVILGDTDDLICIENFARGCTPYNYQPVFYNYTHNGHSREDFYYEMAARGYVNIHSTTNGQSTMDTRFLTQVGIIGALTDNVYLTSNYSYYVDAEDQTLDVGEALDLTQTVLRVDPLHNGEVECGFVQLSGPTLTNSGEGYTLSEPGVATLVYYADTTGGNVSYRVYSAPVTVTFTDGNVDTKVQVDEGIQEVPAALQQMENLNTAEKIESAMAQAVISRDEEITEENSAVYEVELQYSEDGGQTWHKADSEHFPNDGKLWVTLPYPAGTNKDYKFYVAHMFTTSDFGKTPGDVEYPAVTNTDSGIRFYVTGLSPISVAWTEPETTDDTPVIYPTYPSVTTYPVKAGDTNSINGSVAISSVSAMAGSTVTVTVDPDAGYVLGALSVTTTNGVSIALTSKGGGVYTFTMPAGAVTVSAYFQAAAACDGGVNCPASQFTDVSATAWYHEYVDYAVVEGLMGGIGGGKFAPNGTMSRAMVWTVLGRQSGADVDGGSPWYGKAQTWSMTAGVSDGTDPNGSITREQLVTMLYRFVGSPQVGISELGMLSSFDDGGNISPYAQQAMAWAVGNGIIEGSGNKLDPQSNATRAQFAAILMRFCQL